MSVNDLPDIIRKIKPCDTNKPYIFISYSQSDRDLVWNDVLEFQNRGYNIWLDEKNLDKTNASWKEDALTAIEDMECALLIFYVSASSLSSNACYQELSKTIAENTKALHFGPVKFIAIDAESIGDITEFHQKVFEKIKTSHIEKEERKIQALTLNKFMNQFFNSNNEKVRIHPKNEKNRKTDYYEEILALFPDTTKIYSLKQSTDKTEAKTLLEDYEHFTYYNCPSKENIFEEKLFKEYDMYKAIQGNGTYQLNNGYTQLKVGIFGKHIFNERADVKIVKLPDSIKKLSAEEFCDCKNLQEIYLPKYLNIIESRMFENCVSLSNITIPGNVVEIKLSAFKGCHTLKELKLPFELKKLGTIAFEKCSSLTKIYLPPTLEEIGAHCFEDCNQLQQVSIPKNIITLKDCTFKNCNNLEELKLPINLKQLETSVFKNCSSLNKVHLPLTLQNIGMYCFENCSQLQKIIIPKNTINIDSGAFQNCCSLKEINFPIGLKKLSTSAFEKCSSLKELFLPPTLEELGAFCFKDCISLQEVIIPETLKKLKTDTFKNCSSLKRVYLMDGIKEIDATFKYCGNKLHIRIPNSVTHIDSMAFYETLPIIYCNKNSYAYEYAIKHHFTCISDMEEERKTFWSMKKDIINYLDIEHAKLSQ